jgi:hypothetical protein
MVRYWTHWKEERETQNAYKRRTWRQRYQVTKEQLIWNHANRERTRVTRSLRRARKKALYGVNYRRDLRDRRLDPSLIPKEETHDPNLRESWGPAPGSSEWA